MGEQIEIPLASTVSEQDISGVDKLVNVLPRISTGTKYPFNLINAPGVSEFITLPTGPIKGMHKKDGRAWAVTATRMYELLSAGAFKDLGPVDLAGDRVVMDSNGIQVVVVDGLKGFFYDDNTKEVLRITDPAFFPATHVAFQDGYFIFNRDGTGQFFITQLFSVIFDAADFATAEGQPDELVAIISDHREVFLFGSETIEVWFNSGAADFPFERNQGAFVEKGCAARYTIAKQDNTIFFVGSDLMVYRMEGYSPVRISSHAVEETIKGVDLSDAFSYVYQEEGQLFYVLTIPESKITWVYDVSVNAWHTKSSYGFDRHISNNAIFFQGKTLVGDFQSGRIYQMSSKTFLDDDQPVVRVMTLPTVNIGRKFTTVDSFEFDMSSGVGLVLGQGNDPIAQLRVSKDNGKTFTSWRNAFIGKIGNYGVRVKWNRLGVGRQFVFEVRISDPIPVDIGGAYIEIS